MGNTTYQNSNLQIFIQTQKHFYNSGSSIEGTVFVEAFQNFNFDALYIRIQGEEWCQWFEGSSKNRMKYTGSQNFYKMEYLLDKYPDQTLPKGKSAHPFSIELSQNLPGSFKSSTYDAKIQYKLIAYFVNYNDSKKWQAYQLPIIIRQPFRQDALPYQGESLTNPATYGLFSQGEVRLKSIFERNVCLQGETLRIDMQVDNTDGRHNVQQIIVKLVQYTFISSNSGVSRRYKKVIYKQSLKRLVRIGEKAIDIAHTITVPNIDHPTSISTLIANYYRLQVVASLGTFSSGNPSVYCPLFVLKKNFAITSPKSKIQQNPKLYDIKLPVVFRAPQYFFKKNRNLSIMNFRTQDIITESNY